MPTHWTSVRDAISAQVDAEQRLLVACDFDGTISAIVAQPGEAIPEPRAIAALSALASLPDVKVAIVSGRELTDIISRAEIPAAAYSGNHGLQFEGFGFDDVALDGAGIAAQMGRIALSVGDSLSGLPGIIVENKGFTVSVHYRNIPEEHWALVEQVVSNVVAAAKETELNRGNMVWEVKPATGLNKGTAVSAMCGKLGLPPTAVIYIGDDTTDETVFAAFPDGITLRVGTGVETAARWSARDPDDVSDFLEWLLSKRIR